MTLDQLFYFYNIVKHGSIRKAADACHISYPALSKSLKNLEKELNFSLLDRSSIGISLTRNGEIFYEDIVQILQLRKKWDMLADVTKESINSNKIRIYASFFYSIYIFPKLLPILNKCQCPYYYLPCQVDLIPSLLHNSSNQQTTIALTSCFPQQTDLISFANTCNYIANKLFEDNYIAYFNRSWFEEKYGLNVTEIDASELRNIPSIKQKSSEAFVPFHLLYNLNLPNYEINQDENILPYLKNPNVFALLNASLKNSIEQKNSYIKGIAIKNPPLPLRIDYYMLYPQSFPKNYAPFLNTIRTFFEK